MTRLLLISISMLLSIEAIAQHTNLSDYSYVIVPEQFDFLKGKDQFQMNSMTKFYFEKSGFNAYMADAAPNANRCDGLYAEVENLRSILGTKLQIVLKDCNDNEIYRSQEGKSKYKEFDKTYQDALRKAFKSIEILGVNQKDVVLLSDNRTAYLPNRAETAESSTHAPIKTEVSNSSGAALLPDLKFSNYSLNGRSYLLRKTAEGYSLYEESSKAEDGLQLKGKIIVMDKVIKYMDTSGKVWDASFDPSGNLTISDTDSSVFYRSEN